MALQWLLFLHAAAQGPEGCRSAVRSQSTDSASRALSAHRCSVHRALRNRIEKINHDEQMYSKSPVYCPTGCSARIRCVCTGVSCVCESVNCVCAASGSGVCASVCVLQVAAVYPKPRRYNSFRRLNHLNKSRCDKSCCDKSRCDKSCCDKSRCDK